MGARGALLDQGFVRAFRLATISLRAGEYRACIELATWRPYSSELLFGTIALQTGRVKSADLPLGDIVYSYVSSFRLSSRNGEVVTIDQVVERIQHPSPVLILSRRTLQRQLSVANNSSFQYRGMLAMLLLNACSATFVEIWDREGRLVLI